MPGPGLPQPAAPAPDPPRVGEPFPSLTLQTRDYRDVRMPEEFAGRNVLMAWFPVAFSPVCTEQLAGFHKVQRSFDDLGTEVVGVSVDHWYTNEAYRASLGAGFPILSDWWRTGAQRLGILIPDRGYPRRVLYLVDRDGVLRWTREYPTSQCPRFEEFEAELRQLA